MKFPGLKTEKEIQDVIAFLKRFDAAGHSIMEGVTAGRQS
jgi:hypothetical protein